MVEGTLYPLLTRLKNDNLLSYEWVESTQGPPRKYYRLTTQGEEFLLDLEAAWDELSDTVNHLDEKPFNVTIMKKTLTVNLGGTVYHIDEDAYVLLDNYLNNLRYYFRREEGAEEIVRDIENRIGELFDEYLRNGQQVITVENVEAVIERMGKPEQLDEETPESESSAGTRREERPRRLFRDPDDRVLGGVASGLAAYFNWDPMWVRIALILLAIPVHGLILVYLIAWIVIPVAHTATEKLQMHGRTISMENIGRTVTDSFERVNDYVRSDKPRSILHRIGSGIVQMVGLLMRLVLILIAICLAPVLFAGIVTVFALIMAAMQVF
mgnify:CR=1 FL=1